ncbi:unnamed protein product, partial [Prunus brigantina]
GKVPDWLDKRRWSTSQLSFYLLCLIRAFHKFAESLLIGNLTETREMSKR